MPRKLRNPSTGRFTAGYPLTPEERFWAKVHKTESCWLWTGYREPKGYGRFRYNGKPTLVHRFSYELVNGPVPEDMELDHLCRIHHCVNPDHLEAVPHKENLRRGMGFDVGSLQRSKTHCPHGHLYDEHNTYYDTKGRQCKICKREAVRRYRDRQKRKV